MAEHASEEPVEARRPQSAEEVNISDVIQPFVRHWRLLLGLPAAFGVFVGLISLVLPSVYTAQTTLTAAASTTGGGLNTALASLAGLAGQLGVSSGSGGSLTPDFISDVLKSREVLTGTLKSEFRDPGSRAGMRPLLDILRIERKSEAARLSEGVRRLASLVKTRVDHSTGIVTLMVRARDPELAASIANRMRDILNSFNLERGQSQSHEQARFTRERLDQAETELHEAEAAQLRFLQANRNYSGSPILEFDQARLRRAVDLKQEVYISLAKTYEEARIAEVRDTPVITTIDSAVAPDRRSSPRPLLNGFLAVLIGGVAAFLWVFLLEQRRRAMSTSESGPQNLREAWPAARGVSAASTRGSAASGV